MLRVTAITDEAQFDALEPIWNPLLIQSKACTLFLSFEWLRTWWRYYGTPQTLFILVFYEGQKPVGLAPLFKQRRLFRQIEEEMTGSPRMILPSGPWDRLLCLTELSFLGSGDICSDYLDIFCMPGSEGAVAESLCAFLTTTETVDLINLLWIPEDSAVRQCLQQAHGPSTFYHQTLLKTAFYAPLPSSYPQYLETLSKKSRYNARKKLKELQRQYSSIRLEYHRDPDTLNQAMNRFIQLHHQRWACKGGSGAFNDQAFIDFHKKMSRLGFERGWLRLAFLMLDDQEIVGLYGYQYEQHFYFYQQGCSVVDPSQSLGQVAISLAIEQAIAEGVRCFDFLRGDHLYKRHWAKGCRNLYQIQLISKRLRGLSFRFHSAINTSSVLRRQIKNGLAILGLDKTATRPQGATTGSR
jgi:CelD/BcsL family acetyltransferase involved in cellulose biosynthesis